MPSGLKQSDRIVGHCDIDHGAKYVTNYVALFLSVDPSTVKAYPLYVDAMTSVDRIAG